MFVGLLSLLPIIGPLIDGAVAIIKGHQDTQVKKAQIDAGVTVEAMQAANTLTIAMAQDAAVRFCRDIIMFPGSVYCGTYIWDRWIEIQHPSWVWGVKSLEGPLAYLPYALLTFFFGSAYLYYQRQKPQ